MVLRRIELSLELGESSFFFEILMIKVVGSEQNLTLIKVWFKVGVILL